MSAAIRAVIDKNAFYPHTPGYAWTEEQIKNDPQVVKYREQKEMMLDGIRNGEYEIYIG